MKRLLVIVGILLIAAYVASAQINTNVLLYDATNGEAVTYHVDYYGEFKLIRRYDPGTFSPNWTHIVNVVSPSSSYLLYYNAANGAASIGKLDEAGAHHALREFAPGSFTTGWTHVVSYFDGFIFYTTQTGALAYVRLDSNLTPQTIKSYAAGAAQSGTAKNRLGRILTENPRAVVFNPGWTHLVSTYNGMLFYNSRTGQGEFGRFDTRTGEYTNMKLYAGGVFGPLTGGYALGWTHVVWSPTGILFYNERSSRVQIGRIDTTGEFTKINSYDAGAFATGWTHIANTRNGIFFYSSKDGFRLAVGRIDDKGLFTTVATNYVPPAYKGGTNYRPLTHLVEAVPR